MSDIFLSYASEDVERVRPLVERLEEHGWSVWWDRAIPPGQTWTQMIEDALDESEAMVVVWSEASVKSDWVEIEATKGKQRGGLIPVIIEAVDVPLQFALMQAADLTKWDHSLADPQLQSVLRQLERTLGVPEAVDGSSGNQGQAAPASTPDLPYFGDFNQSLDSSTLAYEWQGQLWVRPRSDLDATPIGRTSGGSQPYFSPDGQRIVFTAQDKVIKIVSLLGGPLTPLVAGSLPYWAPNGDVYATVDDGVVRVRETGELESLTQLREGETAHWLQEVLPGGKGALITVNLAGGEFEIWTVWLDTGTRKRITQGGRVKYASSRLFYLLDGTLMVARFDPEEMTLLGPAAPIVANVLGYSVTEGGRLVYSTETERPQSELVWVSLSGEVAPVPPRGTFVAELASPRLSPDGVRVAYSNETDGNEDVWIMNLADGTAIRLTRDEAPDRSPRWAPGDSVTFVRQGAVWITAADGTGEAARLHDPVDHFVVDGFLDTYGQRAVLRTEPTGARHVSPHILVVNRGVDSAPVPLLKEEYAHRAPALSPDGRLFAYVSNESNDNEVFVRPYPHVDSLVTLISVGGGIMPVWARSGSQAVLR